MYASGSDESAELQLVCRTSRAAFHVGYPTSSQKLYLYETGLAISLDGQVGYSHNFPFDD